MTKFVTTTHLSELYPSLASIAPVGLVVPASTADHERGFSTVGRIKTVAHNRLSFEILQSLIFISVEGPSLSEFDFGAACDKWASASNRRVNVSK